MSSSSTNTATSVTSVQDFLKTLKKSGILNEQRLEQFLAQEGGTDNPVALAKAMEAQKLITSFQRRTLLAGRYRGLLLGPYKIMEPIGKGGMGQIYLAEHTSLQRQVAIKVLPVEKARKPELLQRFYREARAAAALDHPNIVKLFDVSQGAGTHFLVMEYVPGKNLQQLVSAHGALPYQKVVPYLVQTASGLQHAHERGFVHRDIKPDNIVLSREGVIKILDMGLARSLDQAQDDVTKMLNPNAIYGSVDYVSPEQSIGGKVDARSDFYSLGATAFALLTGRAPFQGTSAQVLVSHQMEAAPDLSRIHAAVPPELSAIVSKLMAKQPEDRYQSAAELIDALLPWMPSEQGPISSISQSSGIMSSTRVMTPTSAVSSRPTQEQTGRFATEQVEPSKSSVASKRFKKKKKTDRGLSPAMVLGIVATVLVVAGVIIYMTLTSKSTTLPPSKDIYANGHQDPNLNKDSSKTATTNNNNRASYVTKNPPLRLNEEQCVFLDFADKANCISTSNIFADNPIAGHDSITLPQWGRASYHGVPFNTIDPKGTRVSNVFIFEGGDSNLSRSRPNGLTVTCNSPAKNIYLLGGISGWAFPFIRDRNCVLEVYLHYVSGESERIELVNGVHFADWRMPHGEATAAPVITQYNDQKHLRLITLSPKRSDVIREIEFMKKPNVISAPIIFAITVEKP